jgi:hypothetical protein
VRVRRSALYMPDTAGKELSLVSSGGYISTSLLQKQRNRALRNRVLDVAIGVQSGETSKGGRGELEKTSHDLSRRLYSSARQ